MIRTEKIAWLPHVFWTHVDDEVNAAFVNSCIAISHDNCYVTDERGTPLLFVWAHRNSLFSVSLELCAVVTRHLKAKHARECRKKVRAWIRTQPYEIYGRCSGDPKTKRFLEFMGFEFYEELEGITRYKAVK